MVNYGVIFSPMAFKLGANRVQIGKFNMSSGFFEIQKIKIFPEFVGFRILTLILWVSTQLGVCLSET